MTKGQSTRKRQFKAARALAGITAKKWAETNEISFVHLNEVLNGRRDSKRLDEKIDAFIGKYFASSQVAA